MKGSKVMILARKNYPNTVLRRTVQTVQKHLTEESNIS